MDGRKEGREEGRVEEHNEGKERKEESQDLLSAKSIFILQYIYIYIGLYWPLLAPIGPYGFEDGCEDLAAEKLVWTIMYESNSNPIANSSGATEDNRQ